MKNLIINKIFFKNYINYELNKYNSKKDLNQLPNKYYLSYNYKNLLIDSYLVEKTLKIYKMTKIYNFFLKPTYYNYKINMFFNTRKYKIKKVLKKSFLKKKK